MDRLEMADLAPKVAEVVLSSPYKDRHQELATISILTLQSRLNALAIFSFTIRDKKITDKRRETVTELLSDIVFYATILLWLNDLDAEEFSFSAIEDFSQKFSLDYQSDAVLATNLAMTSSCELLELMFDDEGIISEMSEISGSDAIDFTEQELLEEYEDEVGAPIPEGDIAQHIATIFAMSMVLAEIHDDTDFSVVLYNASCLTSEDI